MTENDRKLAELWPIFGVVTYHFNEQKTPPSDQLDQLFECPVIFYQNTRRNRVSQLFKWAGKETDSKNLDQLHFRWLKKSVIKLGNAAPNSSIFHHLK